MSEACSSYRGGGAGVICADGFIQTSYCRLWQPCHACKKYHESVPNCMREDLPAHWLNDDGSPRFRPAPLPQDPEE